MAFKRARLKSELPKKATYSVQRSPLPSSPDDVEHSAGGDAVRRAAADRTTMSKRRLQRRVTPLQILQQPLQAATRKVFDLRRFLLVLLITGFVLLLPTPAGLSSAGHRSLALFVFTASILALEPAPLPIAALLVPIGSIALGLNLAPQAFASFGQPVVFLIMSSLFLAEALRKHGLTRRLALYVIVFSKGNFYRLVFGLMLVTSLLSMWVLNTATTAVLIPVAITIAQRIPQPDQAKRALSLLILSIAYAAGIGAIVTIIGSGENAIAASQLARVTDFGFFDWMKLGLPVMIGVLPLSWFMLLKAFRLPNFAIDTRPAAKELERIGDFSSSEREILWVMALSVGLWVGGGQIESWLGLPQTVLSSVVVAIGAVALLSIEEIIDWNDLKGVSWGVFFVIGAGLTLGTVLDASGASKWFAYLLSPILQGLPYMLVLTILMLAIFVLTQFLNSVTLGAVFVPILISMSQASGYSPVQLVLPAVFSLAFCYMLPNSSARMTLVAVTGAVTTREMAWTGLVVGFPSIIFLILFFGAVNALGLI